MQESKPDIAALLSQIPDADRPGGPSKFTGPPPDVAERIAKEVLGGGRESLEELARMIRDANGGGEKNYKPGYLLHCIGLQVGRPDMEKERRLFNETITSLLGGDDPPKEVQKFLIRELQVAGQDRDKTGDERVVETLGKLLPDAELCDDAVSTLVAIGASAAGALRLALPQCRGRSQVSVVQALGALGDEESVAALKGLFEAGKQPEESLRQAAVWALARSGNPSAVESVVRAAQKAQGWERVQATKACLLLAETLAKKNRRPEADKLYRRLVKEWQAPADRYLREAAERGLGREGGRTSV